MIDIPGAIQEYELTTTGKDCNHLRSNERPKTLKEADSPRAKKNNFQPSDRPGGGRRISSDCRFKAWVDHI